MRTWKRVPAATLCGRCDRFVEKGEAGQYIRVGSVKRELLRCSGCANGPTPPDLPPLRDYVQNEREIGDFAALQSAMPKRTRGELRSFADTWSPYKESE